MESKKLVGQRYLLNLTDTCMQVPVIYSHTWTSTVKDCRLTISFTKTTHYCSYLVMIDLLGKTKFSKSAWRPISRPIIKKII